MCFMIGEKMKKKNLVLYLCIIVFGIAGIYLTFIAGNISKYDSQTKAYRIDARESWDSDDGTIYYPVYYFKANGKDYQCESKAGSSFLPNQNKNIVYYDSKNPENCKSESEKSSSIVGGIICLAVAVLIVILAIKKPSQKTVEPTLVKEIDPEKQYQINQNIQKAEVVMGKIELIIKRVVLGIIIVILLILNLIDAIILKQTIMSKDYIETTAIYVDKKVDLEDSIFDEYIYTFMGKDGNQKEIIYYFSKNENPKEEIKIKYNENNPQDYYDDGSTMEKSELIWFIIKLYGKTTV